MPITENSLFPLRFCWWSIYGILRLVLCVVFNHLAVDMGILIGIILSFYILGFWILILRSTWNVLHAIVPCDCRFHIDLFRSCKFMSKLELDTLVAFSQLFVIYIFVEFGNYSGGPTILSNMIKFHSAVS